MHTTLLKVGKWPLTALTWSFNRKDNIQLEKESLLWLNGGEERVSQIAELSQPSGSAVACPLCYFFYFFIFFLYILRFNADSPETLYELFQHVFNHRVKFRDFLNLLGAPNELSTFLWISTANRSAILYLKSGFCRYLPHVIFEWRIFGNIFLTFL